MPITEKMLEMRKNHVGASESSAILGLNPWKTAYDVWLDKTGKLENKADVTESQGIGLMIEDGLLDWCAGEMSVKIRKNQFRVHQNGILSATHDALVEDKAEGLEAKTSGISFPTLNKELWGEDGSDQVPDWVVVQCQHQAAVSNLDIVHVPALIGGRGRLCFHVERSETLINVILERVTEFWDNVKQDIPPEGIPSLDVVRFVRRTPGLSAPVPAELVVRWQELANKRKEAKEAEDKAQAALLAVMGEAEIGESEAGIVTVRKSMRAGYTVKESEVTRVTFKKAKQLTEGQKQ